MKMITRHTCGYWNCLSKHWSVGSTGAWSWTKNNYWSKCFSLDSWKNIFSLEGLTFFNSNNHHSESWRFRISFSRLFGERVE